MVNTREYNNKRFSIFESEEKTALELMNKLGQACNEVLDRTDEVENLTNDMNNKKVSYDDLHTKYQLTSDGKTANFNGSWQGLKKPTLTFEGAAAQVEKNMADIRILNDDVVPGINDEIDNIISTTAKTTDLITLERRMDEFTKLTQSSTTGDAELIDGRISLDGQVFSNIGGNIRNNFKEVNDSLRTNKVKLYNLKWQKGLYYSSSTGEQEGTGNLYRMATTEKVKSDYPLTLQVIDSSAKVGIFGYNKLSGKFDPNVGSKYGWITAESGEVLLSSEYSYNLQLAPVSSSVPIADNDKYKIRVSEYSLPLILKDDVESIISELNDVDIAIRENKIKIKNITWQPGLYYSSVTGEVQGTGNLYRMATTEKVSSENDIFIKVLDGDYKIGVFGYDKITGAFSSKVGDGYGWIDISKGIVQLSNEYMYNFQIARNSGAEIVLSDKDMFDIRESNLALSLESKIENVVKDNTSYGTIFKDKEDEIIESVLNDKDANTITIGVITDTHEREMVFATKYAKAINKISEKCGANAIVHMGDVIQGGEQSVNENKFYLNRYMKEQNNTYLPILLSIGHHEMYGKLYEGGYWNDDTAISQKDCIGIMGKLNKGLNVVRSSNKSNWYTDIEEFRLIGLNSACNTARGFDSEVITFLQTALSNTDKKVIVFSHTPTRSSVNGGGASITDGDKVEQLLNAYSGKVMGHFHGHVHWDNIVKESDLKYHFISVCCAVPWELDIDGNRCSSGDPVSYPRVEGEYSEYCFDIVNFHADTNTIKLFRFGVGSDRVVNA